MLTAAIQIRAACVTGELEPLKKVIQQDHKLVQSPHEYGKSPLAIAAGWGHNELVDYLLEQGAEVNHIDELGWTPL
ncbi:MAG: hypothetical protein EZS28_015018, partial [Streblomastix strix]